MDCWFNSVDYINRIVDFRKEVFDRIASRDSEQLWLKASLKDVKKVVLINSAPRSGSSLLFAILKKIPQIYSLSGESVPFYKLNRLSSDSFASDKIPDGLMDVVGDNFEMSRDFLSDFSILRNQDDIINDHNLLHQYIDELVLRFSLQWPQISFSYDLFKKLAIQAFAVYLKVHQRFSKEEFYLELLTFLRSEYNTINPYYYDIPEEMIKKKFPEVEVPLGPPNNILMIEEPPFILLSGGKKINRQDLLKKILLLKSPLDCYRMNYIENIFPNAQIKVIHLTRNPLASINGLYDGWLYRGFFSHNLKTFFKNNNTPLKQLKISGYSDKYEWGKWWWNFDLPPGWQDFAEKSLLEVCTFQWYSAHKTIQENINNDRIKVYQIKYENIVKSLPSRVSEIEKILDFIEIDHNAIKELGLNNLPVVQATSPPKPYRWKEKQKILLPLVNNPKISEMCTKLGYDKERVEEWL